LPLQLDLEGFGAGLHSVGTGVGTCNVQRRTSNATTTRKHQHFSHYFTDDYYGAISTSGDEEDVILKAAKARESSSGYFVMVYCKTIDNGAPLVIRKRTAAVKHPMAFH